MLFLALLAAGSGARAASDPHDPALVAADGRPLVLTAAGIEAEVSAGVAVVDVTHAFHNPYDEPLDVVYTFPLANDAAVRSLQLRCGDRILLGRIDTKEAARQAFDEAQQQGRKAALLEQQRTNLFTHQLTGLCPGEDVTVALQYVQQVPYDDGTYTLSFPTSVGERYDPPPELALPPLAPPRTNSSDAVTVKLALHDGAPRGMWSDSHSFQVLDEGAWGARITMEAGPRDRDFVFSWTMADTQPRVVTVVDPPGPDQEWGTVAVTLEPQIVEDFSQQRQRELVFVMDASCSMRGHPWDLATEAVSTALDGMRADDTFNLVRFSDASSRLFDTPQPATEANVTSAKEWLARFEGGGTVMERGILDALTMPGDPEALRLVLLLTDGYIGTEAELFGLIRRHLGHSRLFALGVGSSVNRMLLEGAAEMGRGAVTYQLPDASVDETVEAFHQRIAHPAMTDVTVDWGSLDVADQVPAVVPDLWAGQPLRVVARTRSRGSAQITVQGTVAGQRFRQRPWVELDDGARHEGVSTLWARKHIHGLTYDVDLDAHARRAQITATALEHQLVSDYTSLVATESAPSACGRGGSTHHVPDLQPHATEHPATRARTPSSTSGYKTRTVIDFEGVDVTGELVAPQGRLMLDRRRTEFNPLIKLRTSFDPDAPPLEVTDELTESRATPSRYNSLGPSPSAAGLPVAQDEGSPEARLPIAAPELREHLRLRLERLRTCRPLPSGLQITVWLERGRVFEVLVASQDEALVACVTKKIRRWRFDDALTVEVDVTYP
ncbi:MAG: VWA domain-containing protein [Myxococcales bacterium]|nr:VWA domain-containing protein [Myxococcales bacterium]